MTRDSVLLHLLLSMLLGLCLLPYCLKTEVFLTAGLFSHKAVWFQLAGNYSYPRADLLVRDAQRLQCEAARPSGWLPKEEGDPCDGVHRVPG